MTVIAYKDGIMACDSSWTDDHGTCQTLLNKITRLSSGALLGEAGDCDSRSMHVILDKVKCFDKMPLNEEIAKAKVDYAALLVFPNGEVCMVTCDHDEKAGWRGQAWKLNRGFATCGSGADIALGFMGAGKSAAEACAFVCRFADGCRLPIHSVPLKPTKKVPRAPSRRR